MKQVGEKLLNLDTDRKKKIRSLGKITREKIFQPEEEQERKIGKEDGHQVLVRRDYAGFYT